MSESTVMGYYKFPYTIKKMLFKKEKCKPNTNDLRHKRIIILLWCIGIIVVKINRLSYTISNCNY